MKPLEVKNFRKKYQLSQQQLAEIVGSSIRAVQSWEQGQRKMSLSAIKLMENYREKQALAEGRGQSGYQQSLDALLERKIEALLEEKIEAIIEKRMKKVLEVMQERNQKWETWGENFHRLFMKVYDLEQWQDSVEQKLSGQNKSTG